MKTSPRTRTTRKRAASAATHSQHSPAVPHLGLVCITAGPEVRYRTITRTRFLALGEQKGRAALEELYRHNLQILFQAVDFCRANDIRLYRVTSNLFPQVDSPTGREVREKLGEAMHPFGDYARSNNVRVVLHPDQFVVLNSESDRVVANSVAIMEDHARTFDLLDLPATGWSAMTLHGGKRGRSDALLEQIRRLPDNVRNRLVLENDECAYGAEQILHICRAAGVPMVFDAHHHLIHARLDSYEHDSIRFFTQAARSTWPDPAWQIVHISNGQRALADSCHHDLVKAFPSAFRDVPWVEVEAKKKELAIKWLRRQQCTVT
ncbi:MAG: hypothetical protein AMXMBFR13_41240 [Phycisphaerae bacterium]